MESDNTKLLNKIHAVQLETNREISDLKIEIATTKDLTKRVVTLEDNAKWIVRAVGGSLIFAIMALILK